MINFIAGAFHNLGVHAVVFVAVSLAIGSSVMSLYISALALRAKQRAIYVVDRAIKQDVGFKELIAHMEIGQNNLTGIDDVLIAIEKSIQTLSDQDRKFVKAGLRQNSRRGVERYVSEMIGRPV